MTKSAKLLNNFTFRDGFFRGFFTTPYISVYLVKVFIFSIVHQRLSKSFSAYLPSGCLSFVKIARLTANYFAFESNVEVEDANERGKSGVLLKFYTQLCTLDFGIEKGSKSSTLESLLDSITTDKSQIIYAIN